MPDLVAPFASEDANSSIRQSPVKKWKLKSDSPTHPGPVQSLPPNLLT
jgi:hypothetical protein